MEYEFKIRNGNVIKVTVDGIEREITPPDELWDKYNNVCSLLNKASRHFIMPVYGKVTHNTYQKFINMMGSIMDFYGSL